MSSAELAALAEVIGYARANRVDYAGDHVTRRMRERRISHRDVSCALSNATDCRALPDDRWCIIGPDLDNEWMKLVVVFEDGLLVITVFGA